MNSKSRWFASFVVIAVTVIGGLFLSTALARQPHRPSPNKQVVSAATRTATYTAGNFTFSAPLQLISNPGIFTEFDAEPEIKIDLFGNIYVTAIQGVPAGTDFWKSTNNGTSFAYRGQTDGAQDHCQTLPQCVAGGGGDDSIAVSNGGYLYVSSLYLGSVTMSASYDGGVGGALPGQKWEVNPAAATIPGDDRQWIAAYGPQTVYMSYTDIGTGVIDFEKSTDAGKTFGAPVQTYPATSTILSDVQGNMAVDQYNGNIYICFIPLGADNQVYIERSTDGGATWTLIRAYNGPAGSTNVQVFPSMAVDRGGNIHIAFSSCGPGHSNCQIELVSSTDQGNSWLNAVQVSNGTATATAVEPTVAAGSPGVVDITWLGSAASSPDVASNWHVFFSQTQNALSANPTFAQNQVEAGVMHQWDICFNGLGCANNPHASPGNRDLLEYYSMAIDADGDANIAYPDTVTNCPTASCTTNTWFTKQTSGSSAYTPPAGLPAATFATNLPMPSSSGRAEPNSFSDSHNCIFGGAIGGPIVMRSKDAGFVFDTKTVALGTGTHGGDFDIIAVPKADGSRPDQIYTADLGITSVHIGTSTNGGDTYSQPGMNGIAGEVSVSSDRMWLNWDRNIPNAGDKTVYLVDHEFTSEAIRFAALTNDFAWSVFTSGMTNPELTLPPTSSLPNTNPGPNFVDRNTHKVFSVFAASTITTNSMAPPFGKMPNVWDAVGAGPAAQGLAPGPFTNFPVFKGLIDSPAAAPSPAPSIPPSVLTYGNHTGSLFPGGDTDKAGNVYAVWVTNSDRLNTVQSNGQPSTTFDVWFAASHDGGQNFYGPWRVSSGIGTCTMPWIAAADAGRVDIVYYQTNSVAPPLIADPTNPGALTGGPNNMPPGSTWNVMFAQSFNANSREPVFTVSQASDHIIHTGSISNGGLFGSSDRSLLDFFEVAVGPDGLANIFCADNGSSSTHINYIRQSGGPLAVANPSAVTCLPPPPNPISAVSRKTHGTITPPFDVDLLPPAPGIECRVGQGASSKDHQVVITFPVAVTVGGDTVSSNDHMATADAPIVSNPGPTSGTMVTVNLHNVSNAQRLTITLIDVSSGAGDLGNISVPMAVLLGDVNASGDVDSADVFLVRQQTLHTVDLSNFRQDLNISGDIDSADVFLARKQTLTSLP